MPAARASKKSDRGPTPSESPDPVTRSVPGRALAAESAPENRVTKKVVPPEKAPATRSAQSKTPAPKKAASKKSTAKTTAAKTTAAKTTAAKTTAAKTTAGKRAASKATPAKSTASKSKSTASKSAASSRTPASGGASEPSAAARKKASAENNVTKTPSASDSASGDAPKSAPRTSSPRSSNLRNSKKWFGPSSGEPKAADTEPPAYLTDEKWLENQRLLLLQERAKYTHNAEMLAAEAEALMADREPGDVQFDEESGEGDTLAVERDRDLALSVQARETVDEIDAALARLENGTYGICIASGEYIPQERLEALPMAAKTVQAQTSIF